MGNGILERKSHLVDSTTVCSNKRKGALGVRCLSSLNKALLCKCSWWFAKEREVFGRQIVSGKHNREVEKEGKRKRAGMGGFLSERWVCGWNMEGHKEILRLSTVEYPSLWAMGGGSSFGMINGVVMSICVFIFLSYLP